MPDGMRIRELDRRFSGAARDAMGRAADASRGLRLGRSSGAAAGGPMAELRALFDSKAKWHVVMARVETARLAAVIGKSGDAAALATEAFYKEVELALGMRAGEVQELSRLLKRLEAIASDANLSVSQISSGDTEAIKDACDLYDRNRNEGFERLGDLASGKVGRKQVEAPGASPAAGKRPARRRPPINQDGTLRRRPGKPKKPGDVREKRLVLRIHPDLMNVLSSCARRKGVTRSNFVERSLLDLVNSDPDNPRLDAIGKRLHPVPVPTSGSSLRIFRDSDSGHSHWADFDENREMREFERLHSMCELGESVVETDWSRLLRLAREAGELEAQDANRRDDGEPYQDSEYWSAIDLSERELCDAGGKRRNVEFARKICDLMRDAYESGHRLHSEQAPSAPVP